MKPRFRSLRARWHGLLKSREVTLDGVTLDAREAVVGPQVRAELLRGTYEFAERRLLRDVLRPGDRVVEIGAGIGAVGLVAARIVGAENVVSYEANPTLRGVIEANQARNGLRPELRMRAVTRDGATVRFFVTDLLLSSSIHDRGAAREIEVESEAIGDVLAEHRPSVLVLDVEGAETDLLPSADLSGLRAIVVETHASVTGEPAVGAMIAAVERAGFAITRRAHRNLLLERRA